MVRTRHALPIVATAIALLVVSLHGQQPPTPAPARPGGDEQGFRFKSGVELINVTATVADSSGRFVSGLQKEDFVVYEDEQPMSVTHFNAERVPVSLGIALDTSGSMAGSKIQAAQDALDKFLYELLDKQDEIFLYRFSNTAVLLQGWTKDRQLISRALGRIAPNGGTALYDVVSAAIPLTQQGQYRKKALLLISDGNDTASAKGIREVKAQIRESEVLVYAVGIDEKLGTEWVIYRPGKILRSYDSNETLGYEMRYLGTARVERFDEVSRMLITTAREEILLNDLLVPAPRETLVNYVPHAPDVSIDSRIIELYNAGTEAGRGFIVVLDRGTKDGLEVGNVLAIYHPSPVIPDPRPYEGPDVFSKLSEATRVIIPPTKYLNVPPERSGLLFVFRVFDRVAYAILLNTSEPVVVGDMARKP
jgi:Mg-chelatase subunit ChlD